MCDTFQFICFSLFALGSFNIAMAKGDADMGPKHIYAQEHKNL